MMFNRLNELPPDPILGLLEAFRKDPNPDKLDLGVGVYKDESGQTPIMRAVRVAEKRLFEEEDTKAYVGPAGDVEFNALTQQLIFGPASNTHADRLITVQTTGGCGALRAAAEFLGRCDADTTIWVSDPTWANHGPLLGDSGLTIREYPYYDYSDHRIRFDAMLAALEQVPAEDVVLFHGCCHNPSGADLTEDEWRAVARTAARTGFTPFVDLAYQGLGRGLDEDAFGIRHLMQEVPELLVASSCSKNFGLYRERTGSVSILVDRPERRPAIASQIVSVIRGIYSMPPHHGAAIVRSILSDDVLREDWMQELTAMRNRISLLRQQLVDELDLLGLGERFSFIAREKGMFSFLGIGPDEVRRLREEHAVYMVDSSRINVAGIREADIPYLARAISAVL